MEYRPLSPALGAEVLGFDPAADLLEGLVRHKVLLLRLPDLTPDEHNALGRRLGEIEIHAFFPNLGPGSEQVSVLDSDEGTVASTWH
ncbi:MAG: TauD/TfdA dioxygenase family protein, partial [Acidimicrobiia bacterium]